MLDSADAGQSAKITYDAGSSNALKFYNNAANERMRIDSSGNVGIGSDSPANNLQVKTGSNGGGITIQRNSSTNGSFADLMFSISTSDAASPETKIRATRGASYDDTDISFITSNSERMRIDSSGRVGIGTDSPDAKLQVSDTSAVPSVSGTFQGSIFSIEGSSTVSLGMGTTGTPGFYSWIQSHDAGGGVNYNLILNPLGGNVGIGTDSPTAFSGYTTVAINNATQGGILELQSNGTSSLRLACSTSDSALWEPRNVPVLFATNNTERMRIDSSGVVKISNTGDAVLTITSGTSNSAKINLGDSSNDDAGIIEYKNDSGGSDYMAFTVATTEKMRITSGGNVLISDGVETSNAKLFL